MNDQTESKPATQPTRRRRWLRWTLILFLVFVGLPAGYYWYARWSLERELAEVIAETDRLDPRWRLEDIEADRKTYRDEENAALQVIKFRTLWTGSSPAAHRDYSRLFDDLPATAQLSFEQIDILQQAFEMNPEGLAAARKLKDMPSRGRFPITYSPDWITTDRSSLDTSVLFIVLAHDAMLLAHEGDMDGALDSCAAMCKALTSYGDQPDLLVCKIQSGQVSFSLVWMLERCLAQGFPKSEQLQAMQQALVRVARDAHTSLVAAMRGQRAGHHRLYQALRDGAIQMSQVTDTRGKPSLLRTIEDRFPAFSLQNYPEHLRYMNELVEAARLPLHEQMPRLESLQYGAAGPPSFFKQSAGLLKYHFANHLYAQARLACAQTGLASERFRIAHERWPASLAELTAAKLLDVVPTDPHDGQPLRLAKRKDGITIYSVGKDKVDNGGNIDPSRGSEPGTDIGFRLWDPDKRRQPPRPPAALDK